MSSPEGSRVKRVAHERFGCGSFNPQPHMTLNDLDASEWRALRKRGELHFIWHERVAKLSGWYTLGLIVTFALVERIPIDQIFRRPFVYVALAVCIAVPLLLFIIGHVEWASKEEELRKQEERDRAG